MAADRSRRRALPGISGSQHRPVLARLLKAQDNDAVRALIALDVLDKDGFAEASALAAKAGNAAAAALLADAEHKKYAPQPKKQRYDFDF